MVAKVGQPGPGRFGAEAFGPKTPRQSVRARWIKTGDGCHDHGMIFGSHFYIFLSFRCTGHCPLSSLVRRLKEDKKAVSDVVNSFM